MINCTWQVVRGRRYVILHGTVFYYRDGLRADYTAGTSSPIEIVSVGPCTQPRPRTAYHSTQFVRWTPIAQFTLCRYYAIAEPLRYTALVSPRRVATGLAASWTGALLLCLPPFSGLVPPYRFVYAYIINFISHRRRSRSAFYGVAPSALRIAIVALHRVMNEIRFSLCSSMPFA